MSRPSLVVPTSASTNHRRSSSIGSRSGVAPPYCSLSSSSPSSSWKVTAEEMNSIESITVGSNNNSSNNSSSLSSGGFLHVVDFVPASSSSTSSTSQQQQQQHQLNTRYLEQLGITRLEVQTLKPSCCISYNQQTSFSFAPPSSPTQQNQLWSEASAACTYAAGLEVKVMSRFSSHPVTLVAFRVDEIRKLELSATKPHQFQLTIGTSHGAFVTLQTNNLSSSATNAKLTFLYKFLHARCRGVLPMDPFRQNPNQEQEQERESAAETTRAGSTSFVGNSNNNNNDTTNVVTDNNNFLVDYTNLENHLQNLNTTRTRSPSPQQHRERQEQDENDGLCDVEDDDMFPSPFSSRHDNDAVAALIAAALPPPVKNPAAINRQKQTLPQSKRLIDDDIKREKEHIQPDEEGKVDEDPQPPQQPKEPSTKSANGRRSSPHVIVESGYDPSRK